MIPVLFVNPFAYMGGGEISLLTILSCLDRRQWKPYVICFANGAFVDEVRALGVEAFVSHEVDSSQTSVLSFIYAALSARGQ